MKVKSVAVVGGGIAGLSAAWSLRNIYDVVLFERNNYLGGHAHTIQVPSPAGVVNVDTGFVVYNERNYPHLTALFDHLGVESQATDMSFSASIDNGAVEYAGSSLNTLFGQRRNLTSLRFWSMVKDIVRFNRESKQFLGNVAESDATTGDFLETRGYGKAFRNHYLLPMAAAIWSCPVTTMLDFPARSLLQFFHNHGLLDLANRPQWRTVFGGSHAYVKRIQRDLGNCTRTNQAVTSVRREESSVRVTSQDGRRHSFDEVILATHADTALRLLENPTRRERDLLSCFRYQTNRTLLHTDIRLMPTERRVWSSWNYLAATRKKQAHTVSVTYWMNNLHRLDVRQQYFVSLNPLIAPQSQYIIAELSYDHPVFDSAAMKAQSEFEPIQGSDRIWFTGSYLGYGFHEDALLASVRVARQLGAEMPWSTRELQSGASPTTPITDEALSAKC